MLGIGRLKNLARGAIGTHRRSPVMKALHGAASFVESAYANEGSSFESNGERELLGKLRPARFRVAIDAGANFGDWSAASIEIWPDCHVHAFEVAPETFRELSERLCSADPRRVTLNCLGLSEEAGSHQMYYFPEHPDQTCDLPRHDTYVTVPFDAQLVTGDEYCDSAGVDTVDFLKIDVEGAEFRVMKGFSRRLSAQKIHCLQFEYGAFATQTRFLLGDYYALLGHNYWIGKIFPGYVDFRDYDWRMENFRFSNYCCVSKLRPDLRTLLSA